LILSFSDERPSENVSNAFQTASLFVWSGTKTTAYKKVIRRIVLSNKSVFKRNSLLGVTYYKIG